MASEKLSILRSGKLIDRGLGNELSETKLGSSETGIVEVDPGERILTEPKFFVISLLWGRTETIRQYPDSRRGPLSSRRGSYGGAARWRSWGRCMRSAGSNGMSRRRPVGRRRRLEYSRKSRPPPSTPTATNLYQKIIMALIRLEHALDRTRKCWPQGRCLRHGGRKRGNKTGKSRNEF